MISRTINIIKSIVYSIKITQRIEVDATLYYEAPPVVSNSDFNNDFNNDF